jgi:hypothetical protein
LAKTWDLGAQLFRTAHEATAHDPFPWKLEPPIVHVEHAGPEVERQVAMLATHYGGVFARA